MSKTVKTLSAANMAFANTIVQQLDVLSVRRKEWEATDYKKANDGLYALLGECLGVFNERFVSGDVLTDMQPNNLRDTSSCMVQMVLVRHL